MCVCVCRRESHLQLAGAGDGVPQQRGPRGCCRRWRRLRARTSSTCSRSRRAGTPGGGPASPAGTTARGGEWAERDRQIEFGGARNSSADHYLTYTLEAAAIAMDHDGSSYVAVAGGWQIARYAWDPAVDPFALEPASEIDISETCLLKGYSCGA
ncbi:hypothetical protein DL767_002252 [Monosporascus sp. MG133]|nr:hypothetical protein DL767_002252 [Monosporascus sp. MG133]